MRFKLVRGRAGTGKSTYCLREMKYIAEQTKSKVIMLVPEQFSYAAEKRLVLALGGAGINGCEVMTFSRLAHRALSEDNLPDYMKPAGKQVLLYQAVEEAAKENNVFSKSMDKPGFLDIMSDLISEMKRYGIPAQTLLDCTGEMEDGMLRRKLDAIARIYQRYTELIDQGFLDSEDDMERLAEKIRSEQSFADTYFWVDEFSDFLPQHYRVLSALIETSMGVTVSLCIDESEDTEGIFAPCVKSAYRLKQTAGEVGCVCSEDVVLKEKRRFQSPELAHLEKYWGQSAPGIYPQPTEDISFFTAKDLYGEVERTAEEIWRLVREKGYRFEDIGVLCGEMDSYYHIIEAVFSAYGIPYFTDRKTAVTDHPIIMLVLSIFDVLSENWSYESVFRYLRTGFTNLTQEETDLLENHVLATGIRGKRAWLSDKPWEASGGGVFDNVYHEDTDVQETVVDEIRRKVIAPFVTFQEGLKRRKTVGELCQALFAFLEEGIDLPNCLDQYVKEFIRKNKLDLADQFRQIWNILMDVLDQLYTVIGQEPCGLQRFGVLLRTALSQYEIGIIPSSIDQVTLGTVERSRGGAYKALFLIGAAYGSIPAAGGKEGILSDADRSRLMKDGIEVAPDTRTRIFDQQHKVYQAVTSASEQLFISCPAADPQGNTKRPAQLVLDIRRMFPKLRESDNLIETPNQELSHISTPATTFNRMIGVLTKQGVYHPLWDVVYDWYEQNSFWRDKLEIIDAARRYKKTQSVIDKHNIHHVYGNDTIYSTSRLETYTKCQYMYFVKYGLRAKERQIWQVHTFDIGTLMHYLIRQFCVRIEDGAKTLPEIKQAWRSADEHTCQSLLEELVSEAKEKILSVGDYGQGRVKFLLRQIERTLRRSAELIRKSIEGGEFAPVGYEQEFADFRLQSEDGRAVRLRGIIDRIDILETEEKAYIRIIDYKSGSKRFSITNLYHQLDLQLAVYAQAAVSLYQTGHLTGTGEKPVEIAGILYNRLTDPMVASDGPISLEDLKAKMQAEMKLDGILLDDARILGLMDRSIQDSDKLQGVSGFLPVAANKDGTPRKSSQLVSKENLGGLMSYIDRTVLDIDQAVQNGEIRMNPYKGTSVRPPCEFCPYGEICLFDGAGYRKLKKVGRDVWEKIREGGKPDAVDRGSATGDSDEEL